MEFPLSEFTVSFQPDLGRSLSPVELSLPAALPLPALPDAAGLFSAGFDASTFSPPVKNLISQAVAYLSPLVFVARILIALTSVSPQDAPEGLKFEAPGSR